MGVGIAQCLRWNGTVWLSSAGAFSPLVCFVTSVAILIRSPFLRQQTNRTVLGVAHTHLDVAVFPTLANGPTDTAIVGRRIQGWACLYCERWARLPSDKVWLLTGRAGDNILLNVMGTPTSKPLTFSITIQNRTFLGEVMKKTLRHP